MQVHCRLGGEAGRGCGGEGTHPRGAEGECSCRCVCLCRRVEDECTGLNISGPSECYSAAWAVEEKPAFSVDPMMAEGSDTSTSRTSFSDVSELPPLKEVRIVEKTPAPESKAEEVAPDPVAAVVFRKSAPEKPKVQVQVREAAQKAVQEIKKTPPKLFVYGVGGAVAVIGILLGGFKLYNYFQDRDSSVEPVTSVVQPVVPVQKAQQPAPQASPEQPQAAAPEAQQPEESAEETQPSAPAEAASSTRPRARKGGSRSVPTVVPAQLTVNSVPEGAEVSFDGSALCQTPCTLTGIAPGQHSVSATKSGFSAANRTLSLASGANSTVSLEMS